MPSSGPQRLRLHGQAWVIHGHAIEGACGERACWSGQRWSLERNAAKPHGDTFSLGGLRWCSDCTFLRRQVTTATPFLHDWTGSRSPMESSVDLSLITASTGTYLRPPAMAQISSLLHVECKRRSPGSRAHETGMAHVNLMPSHRQNVRGSLSDRRRGLLGNTVDDVPNELRARSTRQISDEDEHRYKAQ